MAPSTDAELLAALLAAAEAQGGVFTGQQAGDRTALARLLRKGHLRVVRRQVYAAAAALDPLGELFLEASARRLKVAGDVVVSHRWAAALHGYPLLGDLPALPDLTRPRLPGEAADTAPGLHIAALPAEHRTTLRGVPITTPARTVVDCARTLDVEAAVVLADGALRGGSTRAPDVLAACAGWPGIEQARTVMAFADARADSALESRSRWRLHRAGLPPPDLQLTICDERGRDTGEVDFVWLEQRTILETDGQKKYGTEGVLWREKLREDALRALGFEVARGYWSDSGEELARKVRDAFGLAAQYARPASYSYRETPRRRQQRRL